jgi:hypothetical protein
MGTVSDVDNFDYFRRFGWAENDTIGGFPLVVNWSHRCGIWLIAEYNIQILCTSDVASFELPEDGSLLAPICSI